MVPGDSDWGVQTVASGKVAIINYNNSETEKSDSGSSSGYGNAVVIDHGSYCSLYAHLSDTDFATDLVVDESVTIPAKTTIGIMGDTAGGKSGSDSPYPVHLHFGITEKEKPSDECELFIPGERGYTGSHPQGSRYIDPLPLLDEVSFIDPPIVMVGNGDPLGIRRGPTELSGFMKIDIELGQSYVAYAGLDNWYAVHLPCGDDRQGFGLTSGDDRACTGWVKKTADSCLGDANECLIPSPDSGRIHIVADSGGWNVRKGAGTTFPILTNVWNGQEFSSLAGPLTEAADADPKNQCKSNTWYQIPIPVKEEKAPSVANGWICADSNKLIQNNSVCTNGFVKLERNQSGCLFKLTDDGRVFYNGKVIRAANPLVTSYSYHGDGSWSVAGVAKEISLFPPSPSGRYRIIPACGDDFCGILLILDSRDNVSKRMAIGKYRQIDWVQWSEDERFALLITDIGYHHMDLIDMASYTSSVYPSDYSPVMFAPSSFSWSDSRTFKIRLAKCFPDPIYNGSCLESALEEDDYVEQYFRIGNSGIEVAPPP